MACLQVEIGCAARTSFGVGDDFDAQAEADRSQRLYATWTRRSAGGNASGASGGVITAVRASKMRENAAMVLSWQRLAPQSALIEPMSCLYSALSV